MCGIAVAIDWDDAQATVARLIGGLLHRGDITDPIAAPAHNIAMGTRRLRIVDAKNGAQPKASFDGKILVSLNGEIYNHAELRRELIALGLTFQTESDTEVLANALRAWGANALERLNGMYAFVAYDIGSGEFIAARDPFGVKPLYVVQEGAAFLFCSEMRPLLDATGGEVMLLPPGHVLTRDARVRHYVLPSFPGGAGCDPRLLDEILDSAVRSRIPADLAVVSLFSGGIDSTLVTHYARRYRPDMPAYFIGSPLAPDWAFANAYADQTGLDLRIVEFEAATGVSLPLLEQIAVAVESFEPAVIRPSVYTYLLSRRIHQDGYRVALCGEGADELFAGYDILEHGFSQGLDAGRQVQGQLVDLMHRASLQRVDRCSMRFELEIREPLLDVGLAYYARQLSAEALLKMVDGSPQGKQPLRQLYDRYPRRLPRVIRDRSKVGFSEGAGIARESASWLALFENAISDADFLDGQEEFSAFAVRTKEEFFYLRALSRRMDVGRIPHLKNRLHFQISSARSLSKVA